MKQITSKRKTAPVPENFDQIRECDDCYPKWIMEAGGNDWEAGYTMVSVTFWPEKADGRKRLWFEINHDQFPDGANNDQPEEITDEVNARGKAAAEAWFKEAKSIYGQSKDDDYEYGWDNAFQEALKSKELKKFVKEYGLDKLEWRGEKTAKAKNWYKRAQDVSGTTLQIGRTVYKVTQEGDHYILEGPRSKYSTIRNEKDPHSMFLVNHENFTKSAPNVWLSDKDGTLRVL